jgi:hypothetical protein
MESMNASSGNVSVVPELGDTKKKKKPPKKSLSARQQAVKATSQKKKRPTMNSFCEFYLKCDTRVDLKWHLFLELKNI